VAVLVFGGVFCHLFAPETGKESLSDMGSGQGGNEPAVDGAQNVSLHTAGHRH
jgi:putative MFS transporter